MLPLSLPQNFAERDSLIKQLIEKTTTKQGLSVKAKIIEKVYETGKKLKENLEKLTNIVSDQVLPKWNYLIAPSV